MSTYEIKTGTENVVGSGPYEGELVGPCSTPAAREKIPRVTTSKEQAETIRKRHTLNKSEFRLFDNSSIPGIYCINTENTEDLQLTLDTFECSDLGETRFDQFWARLPFTGKSKCNIFKETVKSQLPPSFLDKCEDAAIFAGFFIVPPAIVSALYYIVKEGPITILNRLDGYARILPKVPSLPAAAQEAAELAKAATPTAVKVAETVEAAAPTVAKVAETGGKTGVTAIKLIGGLAKVSGFIVALADILIMGLIEKEIDLMNSGSNVTLDGKSSSKLGQPI